VPDSMIVRVCACTCV